MFAITNDMAGHSLGCSDQFAIDYQQAMIKAFNVAFNNNISTVLTRFFKSHGNLFITF